LTPLAPELPGIEKFLFGPGKGLRPAVRVMERERVLALGQRANAQGWASQDGGGRSPPDTRISVIKRTVKKNNKGRKKFGINWKGEV